MQILDYEWKPSWEEVRINAAINALNAIILKEHVVNSNPRMCCKLCRCTRRRTEERR